MMRAAPRVPPVAVYYRVLERQIWSAAVPLDAVAFALHWGDTPRTATPCTLRVLSGRSGKGLPREEVI